MPEDPKSLEAIKHDRIQTIARGEAIKYSLIASTVTGAATLLAALRYKKFDQYASASAKVSIPVMTCALVYNYVFPTTVYDAMTHPEDYGLAPASTRVHVPAHHRMMNYIYEHPLESTAIAGVPFAAVILKQQLSLPNLTLSEKLMHSRIYAQGSVLALCLGTFMFRGYMESHGKYPEEDSYLDTAAAGSAKEATKGVAAGEAAAGRR